MITLRSHYSMSSFSSTLSPLPSSTFAGSTSSSPNPEEKLKKSESVGSGGAGALLLGLLTLIGTWCQHQNQPTLPQHTEHPH
jgi:hypothetical protein